MEYTRLLGSALKNSELTGKVLEVPDDKMLSEIERRLLFRLPSYTMIRVEIYLSLFHLFLEGFWLYRSFSRLYLLRV